MLKEEDINEICISVLLKKLRPYASEASSNSFVTLKNKLLATKAYFIHGGVIKYGNATLSNDKKESYTITNKI